MAHEVVTVMTRKGQITVPAEIRKALGLQEGDRIAVSLSEEDPGRAQLRPVGSVAKETFGVLAGSHPRFTAEQLREIAIEEMAENARLEGV